MSYSDKFEINGNIVYENGKLNGGLLSFILYDTYGFPFDLTQQILKEHNIIINEEDFNRYLNEQKNRSKLDRIKNDKLNDKNTEFLNSLAKQLPSTENVFYSGNAVACYAKILAIITDNKLLDEIKANNECIVILDKTVFYATSGGEVGDKGVLSRSIVHDTRKLYGGIIGHVVFARETLKVGDNVYCFSFRKNVGKNHTATHLLQSALKIVLGENVQQKGSQVDENGLRFDFSSNKAMTENEIQQTENIINYWINEYLSVTSIEMTKSEAEKLPGVMKLFDEKYGEKVRVVRVFDFNNKPISTEFCGGIHCQNTGEIEKFAIVSEKSVGSGLRRIIAVTGIDKCKMLDDITDIRKSLEILKEETTKYKSNQAVQARYEALYQMRETGIFVKDVLLLNGKNIDQDYIKIACRHISLKNNKPVFAVLSNTSNGTKEYFCYTTCQKDNNYDCQALIKKLIVLTNGKGGGTANFAQVTHSNQNIDYKKFLLDNVS